MSVGFARYLFVPEGGVSFSASIAERIADALRAAGLAEGPDGDGLSWRPFRPAGALTRYVESLGLVQPTLKIDWSEQPTNLVDSYLPPRGPWCRCPSCPKVIPADGTIIAHPTTGEEMLLRIDQCLSCGEPFDEDTWVRADNRVIFQSRLVFAVVADGFAATLPTLADGCPQLLQTMRQVVDGPLSEVFVAW